MSTSKTISIRRIFIQAIRDEFNISDIHTIEQLNESENLVCLSTIRAILNESETAFELIGLNPLFVKQDDQGLNYATLPWKEVIHGRWIDKSLIKYIGKADAGLDQYIICARDSWRLTERFLHI